MMMKRTVLFWSLACATARTGLGQQRADYGVDVVCVFFIHLNLNFRNFFGAAWFF